MTWGYGIGPVTLRAGHVKDDFLGLVGDGIGFEGDAAVGVEELVGDVGQDEGAAREDAAFGDELEEFVDVDTGVEFGGLG